MYTPEHFSAVQRIPTLRFAMLSELHGPSFGAGRSLSTHRVPVPPYTVLCNAIPSEAVQRNAATTALPLGGLKSERCHAVRCNASQNAAILSVPTSTVPLGTEAYQQYGTIQSEAFRCAALPSAAVPYVATTTALRGRSFPAIRYLPERRAVLRHDPVQRLALPSIAVRCVPLRSSPMQPPRPERAEAFQQSGPMRGRAALSRPVHCGASPFPAPRYDLHDPFTGVEAFQRRDALLRAALPSCATRRCALLFRALQSPRPLRGSKLSITALSSASQRIPPHNLTLLRPRPFGAEAFNPVRCNAVHHAALRYCATPCYTLRCHNHDPFTGVEAFNQPIVLRCDTLRCLAKPCDPIRSNYHDPFGGRSFQSDTVRCDTVRCPAVL